MPPSSPLNTTKTPIQTKHHKIPSPKKIQNFFKLPLATTQYTESKWKNQPWMRLARLGLARLASKGLTPKFFDNSVRCYHPCGLYALRVAKGCKRKCPSQPSLKNRLAQSPSKANGLSLDNRLAQSPSKANGLSLDNRLTQSPSEANGLSLDNRLAQPPSKANGLSLDNRLAQPPSKAYGLSLDNRLAQLPRRANVWDTAF